MKIFTSINLDNFFLYVTDTKGNTRHRTRSDFEAARRWRCYSATEEDKPLEIRVDKDPVKNAGFKIHFEGTFS